jgi:hypothetical protein
MDDIDRILAERKGKYSQKLNSEKNVKKRDKLKKDYSRRKEIVDLASNEDISDYNIEHDNILKDDVEKLNFYLARSDKERKSGALISASYDLEEAAKSLEKIKGYSASEKEKFAQAIVNRAARVFYSADKDDFEVSKETYRIIKDLENEYNVKHRKPGHKKDLESAVSAVIGFGLGIFFLSPNITGNVIGSASKGVSNWVSALFFVFGLIGAYSLVWSKRN